MLTIIMIRYRREIKVHIISSSQRQTTPVESIFVLSGVLYCIFWVSTLYLVESQSSVHPLICAVLLQILSMLSGISTLSPLSAELFDCALPQFSVSNTLSISPYV